VVLHKIKKYRKKHFIHGFEPSVFGSARVGLLVMSLAQDLRLDLRLDPSRLQTYLRLAFKDLRLDPSRLETYLRLAFKDLRLTCNLTLVTCKHLWWKVAFCACLHMLL